MEKNQYIDTNNIVFMDQLPLKDLNGQIDIHSKNAGGMELEFQYWGDSHTNIKLLVVDEYKRFIHVQELSNEGRFVLTWELLANIGVGGIFSYIYSPDSNVATPLGVSASFQADILVAIENANSDFKPSYIPSFKSKYIDMVVNATSEPYVSVSNVDNIVTGNNYQSIDFGEILREGGRPNRHKLLSFINFSGRSVLDIGANTGEISRIARRLGADLVDGYEYDKFFVETGRMVNAVTGMTRVSLFQGDASNRGLYEGKKYDIVLAMAVHVYIKNVYDLLSEVTDVLITETHTLDHGIDMYVDKIKEHFPCVKLLGYPDMQLDVSKSRALLVCGTSEEAVDSVLTTTKLNVKPYYNNIFLKKFGASTVESFETYLKELSIKRSEFIKDEAFQFGGVDYFFSMLMGYMEYREQRNVLADNIFLKKYRQAIEAGTIDEMLAPMLDVSEQDLIAKKVEKKFQDIDLILSGNENMIPPVLLTPSSDGHLSFEDESGETISCSNIDGHHRFFIHQLLSLPHIKYKLNVKRQGTQSLIKHKYTLKAE